MVRLLLRKGFRDLRLAWVSFSACILMVALATSLFIAFGMASVSLRDSCRSTYDQLKFLDFYLTLHDSPPSIVNRVRSLPGVKAVQPRTRVRMKFLLDPPSVAADRSRYVRGRSISIPHDSRPVVNDVKVVQGRYLREPRGEMLLESRFAQLRGIRVGQNVRIQTASGVHRFQIVGLVQTPEYLWMATDAGDPRPRSYDYAVTFVSFKDGFKLEGRQSINKLHFLVEEDFLVNDVIERVRGRLVGSIKTIRPRSEQASDALLTRDQLAFAGMAILFPGFLLTLSAISLQTAMSQLLKRQRRQIGVMLSLGLAPHQVRLHYLVISWSSTALGAFAGCLVGLWLGGVCTRFYAHTLGLPSISLSWPWSLILVAVPVVLLVATLATWTASQGILSLDPVEALRSEFSARRSQPATVRKFSRPWLKPRHTLAFRNLRRHPFRTLVSVLGIAFSVAQVTMSLALFSSQDGTLKYYFERCLKYDLRVELNEAVSPGQLPPFEHWEGVEAMDKGLSLRVKLRTERGVREVTAFGLQPGSKMLSSFAKPDSLQPVQVRDGEVILGPLRRSSLGEVGDEVLLEMPSHHDQPVTELFRFGPSIHEPVSGPLKMSLRELQRLGNLAYSLPIDSVNLLFFQVREPRHIPELKARLLLEPLVTEVNDPQEIRKDIESLLKMLEAYKFVILVFTGLFALVVLTGTTTLNVMERTRELATLRCLGVSDQTVVWLLLQELLILWGMAVVGGAPLGVQAGSLLVNSYQSDQFALTLHLSPTSVAAAAGFSLLICLVALAAALGKISQIPLAAAVQERMD